MIKLGLVMLPFAAIAFAVAIGAIALAAIVPKRRKNRIAPNGDVKIIFMDANGQPEPEVAARSIDSAEPASGDPQVISIGELRTPEQADAIMQAAVVDKVENMEIRPSEDAQPIPELAPRRGFGSFLRFGMSRKREDASASAAPPPEVPSGGVDVQETAVDMATPPRRKLFSGGKGSRVVRAGEVEPESVVASEQSAEPGTDVIASVTTQDGTTSVDARGVIHEQPAEADFPVQRFAENDRIQEVAYASEAERREAEHRMEMERLQAEQQAYDSEQRRALELKDAKHRRALEILEVRARLRNEAKQIEAHAQASVEAHLAKWWIRLDPDVQDPQESDRIRLAGSLEGVRAQWAAKLICTALEQEESERVRARLLGAYARGYRADPAPFEAALTRTQIERWAIIESLSPFIEDAQWIADVVSRAKGDNAEPPTVEQGDMPSNEASPTALSEANVIPLPPPTVTPSVKEEAVVAAAS